MEGGKDPHNRGTYPWRHVDSDLRTWYSDLGNLRNRTECLKRGYFTPLYAEGDVYLYARHFKQNSDPFGKTGDETLALCAVNRGFETRKITVDLSSFDSCTLTDALSGAKLDADGMTELTLAPLSASLYLNDGGKKA